MNRRSFYFLFVFFITLFVGQLFADPIQFTNTYHESSFRKILDHYYEESRVPNTFVLKYMVNDQSQITTKNIIYRDIVVGDLAEYTPKITNPHADNFKVSAEFKKVYFLKKTNLASHKEIIDQLGSYYTNLPLSSPYDLENKNIILDKILLQITKEKIIDVLKSKGVTNSESVFELLVDKKILIEYPMILEINSEFISDDLVDLPHDLSFEINFYPDFASPVKPITGKILFIKEPLKITSKYSLPAPECKTNPSLDYCYITTNDVFQYNAGEITNPEITERNEQIRSWLNNFNVVSGFNEQSFEDINVKELLVKLSLKRELFCFREDNDEYTDTIFRVAKAYDLSMEQAFQLWAIISERSNCNKTLNSELYGFAQVDLKGRDSGNLINIEEITSNSQSKVDSKCFLCGEGYLTSEKYPTSPISVDGQKLSKKELCYKCISSGLAQRCNPYTGMVDGTTTLFSGLKKEICPDSDTQKIDISSTLPLQLAEEEQFQYLAQGNFKEINMHMLNNVYGGDNSKFYNLGYNGIINNDNGYFGFLINAIRNNKDDFGSTVLFASDYLKELNYLVKNSRDKSKKPFVLEDFIEEKPKSINSIFVLASVFNNKKDTEEIYSVGDYLEIFDINSFFLKENNYIKTTKEIRVLLNYLAIKRKYYRDPQYFLKYNLNTDFPESKSKAYEALDHNYWDTKKKIYLKTLKDNHIKLMLKKDVEYYDYDKLRSIYGKPNYCARYVKDFGQKVYLDGEEYYPETGANAWTYDTTARAIGNYTLIWEAAGICDNKNKCSTVPTTRDCCHETKSLQTSSVYNDPLLYIDGAILGVYNSGSRHNNKNREYTHVVITIGKSVMGVPLIAESISQGQSISFFTNKLRKRVKRIYVPRGMNIKNIRNIYALRNQYPPTYVIMSPKKLLQITEIDESLYEDPNLEGEGDLEENLENDNLKQENEYNYSEKIVDRARHYAEIGTKYVDRGRNGYKLDNGYQLKNGIDCVGLLYVVMRDLNYIDGSTSCKEIFENDCAIADFIEPKKKKDSELRIGHILGIVDTIETEEDLDKLQPGDLLFLHTKQYYFGHAGIYDKTLENGDHQYIHAAGPGAPSKVTYNTFEEKLKSGALKLPFHYGRVTQIDKDNIDCSSNFISYYNRKLSCCQATDYCRIYS